MSDFEMCPVGTGKRLAAAEARADRAEQCAQTEAARADNAEAECRRLSEVVSSVNRRSDHLGIRLGEVISERDALLAALKLAHVLIDKFCRSDVTIDESIACQEQIRAAIAKAEGGGNG